MVMFVFMSMLMAVSMRMFIRMSMRMLVIMRMSTEIAIFIVNQMHYHLSFPQMIVIFFTCQNSI